MLTDSTWLQLGKVSNLWLGGCDEQPGAVTSSTSTAGAQWGHLLQLNYMGSSSKNGQPGELGLFPPLTSPSLHPSNQFSPARSSRKKKLCFQIIFAAKCLQGAARYIWLKKECLIFNTTLVLWSFLFLLIFGNNGNTKLNKTLN